MHKLEKYTGIKQDHNSQTLSASDSPLGFSRMTSAWNDENFPTSALIVSQRFCRDFTLLSGYAPLLKLYRCRIFNHMTSLFLACNWVTTYLQPWLDKVYIFFWVEIAALLLFPLEVSAGDTGSWSTSSSLICIDAAAFLAGSNNCGLLLPGCIIGTLGGNCSNPWGNQD